MSYKFFTFIHFILACVSLYYEVPNTMIFNLGCMILFAIFSLEETLTNKEKP